MDNVVFHKFWLQYAWKPRMDRISMSVFVFLCAIINVLYCMVSLTNIRMVDDITKSLEYSPNNISVVPLSAKSYTTLRDCLICRVCWCIFERIQSLNGLRIINLRFNASRTFWPMYHEVVLLFHTSLRFTHTNYMTKHNEVFLTVGNKPLNVRQCTHIELMNQ